jgi:ribosomal protein S18 acetylase RimI-like enzyme
MTAHTNRGLTIQASFTITAPVTRGAIQRKPAGRPITAAPTPSQRDQVGGAAELAQNAAADAAPPSVLRGPRPDLLPAPRSPGGALRGAARAAQPATAPVASHSTSASRAIEAMRARAPRPELIAARPAAVQRAIDPARTAPGQRAAGVTPLAPNQRAIARPSATAEPRAVAHTSAAAGPRAVGQARPRAAVVTALRPQALQLQPGGQPLPSAVRQRMETLFGADLSEVRIHQGAQPASIGAVAFTAGSQIYFAPGQYRPTELAGQRLLATQLAYVLQQRAGMARNPSGRGAVVVRDPALDAQAAQIGELAGRPGAAQAKAARGLFQVKTTVAGPGQRHLELYERGRVVGGADVVLDRQHAKLYNLRVESDHRGRGGGEELVRAAAIAGERIGKRTLALEADDDGSGKLLDWYQRQGFREAGPGRDGKPAFEAPVRALKKP